MSLGRGTFRRAALAALLVWFAAAQAGAGSRVPYQGEFRAEIETAFFEPGSGDLGRVSPVKVAAYRSFIENKLAYVESHLINEEIIDEGETPEEAREKLSRRDTVIALEHILGLLDRMESTPDPAVAYDLGAEVIMVEYATRAYTDPIGSIKIPIHLKNMVFEWRVADGSRARQADREATNLVNPDTGEFYTPDELAALIRSGADLSLLDPPTETPFWRDNGDIAGIDIISNYLEGGDPIHSGVVTVFPKFDGARFVLDKPHLTQSKPKLDVYWIDDACARKSRKKQKKCRKSVKLKFGMETHADPVGNALLSAMGFNIDISMHLKNARVDLGDSTLHELRAAWYGYFDQQRMHTYIPLDSVLREGDAGHGRDESGEYVVFTETVAELKEPEYDRIGFFAFSDRMAASFREARALFIFNAWIANADMKDEENNKLILRRMPDGSRRMYLVQQDVGHAMGRILPEKPEAFPWDLVETGPFQRVFSTVNRSIEFNYINLQDAGLEHTTTYADAKWMVRRIAQLTRKQIEDAVSLGHWPGGIPQLYTEKLINRRNQLVTAFDLEDEYGLMPVDRYITTADGSVVEGELVRNMWDESPIGFNDYYADLAGPVGVFFSDRLMVGLQTAIAGFDVINPGNVRITGELRFLPRVLVHFAREVILNPEPRDETDQYIVVDSVGVGLRLGVGYIASGEVSAYQQFTMAYPVPTRRQGIHGGLGLAHLILPIDVWRGALPERFVLHRELKLKGGARVSTDHSDFLSPVGLDGEQGWVTAFRSVIDRREKDPVVWIDRPQYLEGNVQMFLEAAVLQFPFLGASSSVGSLAGRAFSLDGSRLDLAGDDGVPYFEKMVRRGDFGGAEKLMRGRPRRAESRFDVIGTWWNLLFAGWRSRISNEDITVSDEAGRVLHVEHQSERRRTSNWRFLDNGETQEFGVRGVVYGDGAAPPRVVARFEIDDLNTHSDELDSYYALLRGLAAGEPFLSDRFRARDWEVSGEVDGRWTRMLTEGSVHLREEALRRLTSLERGPFWERLARNLGLSAREFARQEALSRPSADKQDMARGRSLKGRYERRVIRRARFVLGLLDRAAAADGDRERMGLIVKALYRSCFRRGDTFDPVVLATLLQQAGIAELADRDDVVVAGRVTRAFEDERNLPERRDIVGRLGGAPDEDPMEYRSFPFQAIDYYRALDWVREFE